MEMESISKREMKMENLQKRISLNIKAKNGAKRKNLVNFIPYKS